MGRNLYIASRACPTTTKLCFVVAQLPGRDASRPARYLVLFSRTFRGLRRPGRRDSIYLTCYPPSAWTHGVQGLRASSSASYAYPNSTYHAAPSRRMNHHHQSHPSSHLLFFSGLLCQCRQDIPAKQSYGCEYRPSSVIYAPCPPRHYFILIYGL
jgi:hypothetical protein